MYYNKMESSNSNHDAKNEQLLDVPRAINNAGYPHSKSFDVAKDEDTKLAKMGGL